MQSIKRLGLALSVALLALGATAAHAQLVVTLTPDTLTATVGSTITYQAIIENQSTTDTYFLNGITSSTGNITVDNISFQNYVPASLAPGAIYGGTTGANFVDVMVDSSAPANTIISGTFVVIGGTSSNAQQSIATPTFNIKTVPLVVPETSTALLLGLGGIAGIALATRRRKTITVTSPHS